MFRRLIFTFLLLTFCACISYKPASGLKAQISQEVCLNAFEKQLYYEINAYRAKRNLPAIKLSHSLTMVAQIHCRDLAENRPHASGNCNLHSWSRKGPWTPCCYTPDHRRASCMWDKPRELTKYQGDGYEIAYFTTVVYPDAQSFAKDAVFNWSKSKGHNDVIINRGTWRNVTWKAMGVGYYGGYATVWFGKLDDPDSTKVKLCR